MAKLPVQRFVEIVKKSDLVELDELRDAVERCREQHGGQLPDDSEAVASFLIEQGL